MSQGDVKPIPQRWWFRVLVLGVFPLFLLALILAPRFFQELYVINASGIPGLTVLLDGQPIGPPLPSTATESFEAIAQKRVFLGSHQLRVVDASQRVIDERPLEAAWGHFGHLYAPAARAAGACFADVTVGYGSMTGESGRKLLEPAAALWHFDHRMDDWLAGAPRSITTKGDGAVRYGVRRASCDGTADRR